MSAENQDGSGASIGRIRTTFTPASGNERDSVQDPLKVGRAGVAAMLLFALANSGCGDAFVAGSGNEKSNGTADSGIVDAGQADGEAIFDAGSNDAALSDAGVLADAAAIDSGACKKTLTLEADPENVPDKQVNHGVANENAGCFYLTVNDCAGSSKVYNLNLTDENKTSVAFSPVRIWNPLVDKVIAEDFVPDPSQVYSLDLDEVEIFSGQPLKLCAWVTTTNTPVPGEVHQLAVKKNTDVIADQGITVKGQFPLGLTKMKF